MLAQPVRLGRRLELALVLLVEALLVEHHTVLGHLNRLQFLLASLGLGGALARLCILCLSFIWFLSLLTLLTRLSFLFSLPRCLLRPLLLSWSGRSDVVDDGDFALGCILPRSLFRRGAVMLAALGGL